MTDRHRPKELDRRELLIAVGTLAAALGLPGRSLADTALLTDPDFANLANLIAGFPPADPGITHEIHQAFASEAADLARLYDLVRDTDPTGWDAAIASAGLTPLAETLSTAWYTGTVGAGDDQRVVTYLDAFAWYAVGYTKPPTRCDISFGAWSEPPHEYR